MASPVKAIAATIALVGHPNVGKSTLFNRLTGGYVQTSNFSGTTVSLRTGTLPVGKSAHNLVDVPGLNSLEASTPEQQCAADYLRGNNNETPDVVVVILDAMNLERSIFVAREVTQLGLRTIAALNMSDLASSHGLTIDVSSLQQRLGIPIVSVSGRTGDGISDLKHAIQESLTTQPPTSAALNVLADQPCSSCNTCSFADGYRWAATVADESTSHRLTTSHALTERIDRVMTHSLAGPVLLLSVMFGVFASIFWVAQYPMEWIDVAFSGIGEWVTAQLGDGLVADFLANGLVAGVGSVVIFLPQICILFFVIAVLEDSGYLSRAVVVTDRWMRLAGLPGQAFVPMLSAHACAIPAILSTRVISSRRDRLAAILVIPLLTCSARLPVYAMVAAVLFPDQPLHATLLFVAAYGLGMAAAFVTSLILRFTLAPGTPQSLIIDLPQYRLPAFGKAARSSVHYGWAFLKGAGTVILAISVIIWFLSTFPRMTDQQFEAKVAELESQDVAMTSDVDLLRASLGQEHSLLGRIGKSVTPIFKPLGFDWKTSVGVIASFAAREVVVSTLAILHETDEDSGSIVERIRVAKNRDGSTVFDPPTCVALLVFFVLAMQCLPTQAVTRKETGRWSWAVFQLIYMTALAYVAAFAAREITQLLI